MLGLATSDSGKSPTKLVQCSIIINFYKQFLLCKTPATFMIIIVYIRQYVHFTGDSTLTRFINTPRKPTSAMKLQEMKTNKQFDNIHSNFIHLDQIFWLKSRLKIAL